MAEFDAFALTKITYEVKLRPLPERLNSETVREVLNNFINIMLSILTGLGNLFLSDSVFFPNVTI